MSVVIGDRGRIGSGTNGPRLSHYARARSRASILSTSALPCRSPVTPPSSLRYCRSTLVDGVGTVPGKIFVNYRRDDDASAAARVRDALAARFGKSNVFMDVDNLLAGQRFDEELAKALGVCDVLIAVIGPRWMDLLRARAASRERDYVREEIAAALERRIVVIPVRVGRDGQMPPLPRAEELPADIHELVLYQKHDVAHERFGRDMADLNEAIVSVRKSIGGERPSPIRAAPWGWIGASVVATLAVAYVGAHAAGFPVPWPWSPAGMGSDPSPRTAQQTTGGKREGSDPAALAQAKAQAEEAERVRLAAADEERRRTEAELSRLRAEAAKRKADDDARAKAEAERQRVAAEQRKQELAMLQQEEARKAAEAEAARKRAEASAPQPGRAFRDCPDCPEMVVVPAGEFMMGSPASEPERESDETQLRVTIARPFAVGRFAVTFDEWDACVADSGCKGYKPDDRGWGRGKRPVINVNWDDAKAYVAWLSRKSGKSYRLLSEAEREYVTRAGTQTPFWWGAAITPTQANYDGSADPYKGGGSKGEYRRHTVPVDSFAANPWGLYQVHGNVWEWTEDCWNDSNNGNPGNGSARTTGECGRRVVRGGSWDNNPRWLRAAVRNWLSTDFRVKFLGFRVGRTY